MVLHLALCCVVLLLQMTRHSPKGKNIATSDQSTPIAKRTRLSSQSSKDSYCERFRTPLNSHIYSSIFDVASPIVERVVEFNTLKTTFVPRIFLSRDWPALFGNFKDPMDELVKKCYSNISDLRVELICWVRGKEFIIITTAIDNTVMITIFVVFFPPFPTSHHKRKWSVCLQYFLK